MMDDTSLEIYLKEIRKFSLLTAQQEREIVIRHANGDQQARESLITCNLRLVVNIAKKYINCGIPLADLIAEGNIGLIYAVERFDKDKGCRFSTYATFWIKHAICRAITEKNSLVRIPAYMKKILSQCREKSEKLMKQLGYIPTAKEVVEFLEIPGSKREIVCEAMMTNKASEEIQNFHSQNQETIEDRMGAKQQEHFFEQNEVEWIMDFLNSIEPKRAQIIKLRYGLEGRNAMTLKEIALELRLTKERIRQIEKETLKMLRECMEKNHCYEGNTYQSFSS